MAPRTPTRDRSRTRSASPPTTHTPGPSIRSEKSYSDYWWTEQEREQRKQFDRSFVTQPQNFSADKAERRESNAEDHGHSVMLLPGLPRRDHTIIGATSSERIHSSAESLPLVDQSMTATLLESNISIHEDDESQSEYGSEQENQPPAQIPATPPHEPTYRRLQRQPLEQLTIDRNGQLLFTSSSLAEYSPSYPGRTFVAPAQIDEDQDLDSDAESNASTIMLPTTRKRSVKDFEERRDEENSGNGSHVTVSRPTKRLKACRPEGVDGFPVHHDERPALADFAAINSLISTTPSGEGGDDGSDLGSPASTIMPSPRKRVACHMEEDEEEISTRKGPQKNVKKRLRASTTSELAPRGHGLGESRLQRGHRHSTFNRNQRQTRRNLRKFDLDSQSLYAGRVPVRSTAANLQHASGSSLASDSGNQYTGSPLPAHRVWLPSPIKTPVLESTQQPHREPKSPDDVLTRLEAVEDRFIRWLMEVRDKKDQCRRLSAQQKKDHEAIQEDMARIRQLEPIIQTMAAKELDEIDDNIWEKEGAANKLSAQRREVRQRLLRVEKLRHDFEGERLK